MTAIAIDWLTLAYAVPVIVGVSAVVVYMATQAIKGARFHKRTTREAVILTCPVVVRTPGLGGWSRPYGDSLGSNGIDLTIREHSIEVAYVGRPAGGIGGMQWFLNPASTVVADLGTRPDDPIDEGLRLTEWAADGDVRVDIAVSRMPDHGQVVDALRRSGATIRSGHFN